MDVPTAAVPKLAQLARTVAESVPMQAGWLDPVNWPRVRQFCTEACSKLDTATAAASRIDGRISAARLGLVARAVLDLESVESAWEVVRRFCPAARLENLDLLERSADEASIALKSAIEAASSLTRELGLIDGYHPSLRSTGAFCEFVGPLAEAGMLHGAWADASTRSRMQSVCHATVNDLNEAADVQTALQERMSHRAFKGSADVLVSRSAAYQTLLQRMFGGFGAFRREAVDLYKNQLPGTKTLLRDFEQLRRFHRRAADARESAAELTDLLPAGQHRG